MGTTNRRNSSCIKEDLLKNGPTYNVWQAVWLGENITKKDHPERKDYLFDQAGLRFRPYEKYEYPPTDIKEIVSENNELVYTLTFMGLYGVNSPLPRSYHEPVATQQRVLGKGEVPIQNFLDIFNNRFYWLYYNSWKKYRFYLYLNSDNKNKIFSRINSFIGRGLSDQKFNSYLSDFTLLKFSGILSRRVRNKEGLNILLNHIFPQFALKVKEFVPKWVELADAPSIGSSDNKLGISSFAGKYALDYMSRICIEIGPISFEDYLRFLPGTDSAKKITELLKLYLNDGLEFDLKFKINSNSIVSVSWNDDRLKLGSTLWLGKPKMEIMEVYIHYEEIVNVN